MKKILILFAFLLGTSVSYCQSSAFGIKGGINYSNIGGDAAGVKARVNFHAGFFGIIKPKDHFGFQPEIVFSRQGTQLAGGDLKVNYDYVNIPLMFNYYLNDVFFLQGGPQLGVVVSAKVTDGTNSEDVKDQLNSPDFAIGFGFGFDLRYTVIGLRYNAGISTTAKASIDGGKYPNQVLQVSLGFKIE